MTCQELVEHVTGYLDGALDAEARAALEAHLERCHPCREYIEQMRTTSRLVAAAELERRPGSAALLEAFRTFKRP